MFRACSSRLSAQAEQDAVGYRARSKRGTRSRASGRLAVCSSSYRAGHRVSQGRFSVKSSASATLQAMGPPLNHGEVDSRLERDVVSAVLHLREHGWAVLDDVITREDCEQYMRSLWDWLEGLGTGISRSDPKTWRSPHWPPAFKGIINCLEVAHQAFVWRIRGNPRLIKVFEKLWGTNELLSSFDSINCLPPSIATGVPNDQTSWLHADQAPLRRGFFCIQGLVNMMDVGPDTTGTLLVKDGSHEGHAPFFETACTLSQAEKAATSDHYQLKPQEEPFFDSYESMGLRGKAGSVFLWDSRTIHANTVPALTDHWRQVVYACYQPRSFAREEDICLKAQAWEEYRVTTHWPARNVHLFPKSQPGKGYYGEDIAAVHYTLKRTRDEIKDQHRIKQLAGVEEYTPAEIRHGVPLLDMEDSQLTELLRQL